MQRHKHSVHFSRIWSDLCVILCNHGSLLPIQRCPSRGRQAGILATFTKWHWHRTTQSSRWHCTEQLFGLGNRLQCVDVSSSRCLVTEPLLLERDICADHTYHTRCIGIPSRTSNRGIDLEPDLDTQLVVMVAGRLEALIHYINYYAAGPLSR